MSVLNDFKECLVKAEDRELVIMLIMVEAEVERRDDRYEEESFKVIGNDRTGTF